MDKIINFINNIDPLFLVKILSILGIIAFTLLLILVIKWLIEEIFE